MLNSVVKVFKSSTHVMADCKDRRPGHSSCIAVEFGLIPPSFTHRIPESLLEIHQNQMKLSLQC